MRRSFLFPTMLLLSILLGGCEREKAVAEMPAEEVVRRLADLEAKAKNDPEVWRSEGYRRMAEKSPGAFKKLLAEKIRESEHITITEISFFADFYELLEKGVKREQLPEYEYATVRLTEDQKTAALKATEAMDLTGDTESTFCGFSPHHRLDITGRDGKVSSILVCYECLSMVWKEYPMLQEPLGAWTVMDFMMNEAGLEQKKNWEMMAMERYTKEKEAATEGR